jgi:hypothetical protein
MRALSILWATASALAGCTPLPVSEESATRDLRIELMAVDDGIRAKVSIQVSGVGEDVPFSGTDSLKLTTADTVLPLRLLEDSDGIVYQAELDRISGDLVLDLERLHDHSAHLTAAMPPPFTLAAQAPSVTQPLTTTWDAGSGDYEVSLVIEGDCIAPVERTLASDTGAYYVQLAELRHKSGSAPATCPLQVRLTRVTSTQGPLVPSPEGGWFTASMTQSRTIEVDWQP